MLRDVNAFASHSSIVNIYFLFFCFFKKKLILRFLSERADLLTFHWHLKRMLPTTMTAVISTTTTTTMKHWKIVRLSFLFCLRQHFNIKNNARIEIIEMLRERGPLTAAELTQYIATSSTNNIATNKTDKRSTRKRDRRNVSRERRMQQHVAQRIDALLDVARLRLIAPPLHMPNLARFFPSTPLVPCYAVANEPIIAHLPTGITNHKLFVFVRIQQYYLLFN